jgi:acyl-homoserine-lactone acylase
MTRLDKTEGKRVDGTRIGLAPLKLAAALSLSALVACAPDESVSNDEASALSNAMKETVDVRWTEHGIPHITAQTWEGLGFGFAHSVAQNGVCVLAKELITVNGELSKYFGAENGNVNSDAFHRALLNDAKVDQYLGASSDDSNAMDSGYARGYNRYIDTHADQLPASCAGAEWVKPIDERDLARLAIGVGIRYGLGRVTDQIATAAPNQAIAALKPIDQQRSAQLTRLTHSVSPTYRHIARHLLCRLRLC